MQLQLIKRVALTLLATLAAFTSGACGEMSRSGRAPVQLVIESMEASAGEGDEFANPLLSDVSTGGGVFNDNGRASFRLIPKNPGNQVSPLEPSLLNAVTLTRYRVRYIRSDGRNQPGVDVPYDFDGGMTLTVGASGGEGTFLLVRHSAKREPPLRNMWEGGGLRLLTVIAEVTFYGHDQAGNEVSAVGNITITFGDFADPS